MAIANLDSQTVNNTASTVRIHVSETNIFVGVGGNEKFLTLNLRKDTDTSTQGQASPILWDNIISDPRLQLVTKCIVVYCTFQGDAHLQVSDLSSDIVHYFPTICCIVIWECIRSLVGPSGSLHALQDGSEAYSTSPKSAITFEFGWN